MEKITISVDGRGRALDNLFVERLWRRVNYEDVYIKGYANLPERQLGLTEYVVFYTGARPRQALGYPMQWSTGREKAAAPRSSTASAVQNWGSAKTAAIEVDSPA